MSSQIKHSFATKNSKIFVFHFNINKVVLSAAVLLQQHPWDDVILSPQHYPLEIPQREAPASAIQVNCDYPVTLIPDVAWQPEEHKICILLLMKSYYQNYSISIPSMHAPERHTIIK